MPRRPPCNSDVRTLDRCPRMRSYLYKSQSAGVRDYLCNRLYGLPEREVERYLSQVGTWVLCMGCQAAIQCVAGVPGS